jgi:hypothetical protein
LFYEDDKAYQVASNLKVGQLWEKKTCWMEKWNSEKIRLFFLSQSFTFQGQKEKTINRKVWTQKY